MKMIITIIENHLSDASDDCSLILRFNLCDICFVPGSPENIKITYPYDLIQAEEILNNIMKERM